MEDFFSVRGIAMATRKEELEIEVLKLPAGERADLAHPLTESLEATEGGDFEAEWVEEAERRYEAYRQGLVAGRPGREVLREAKARLV